MAALVWMRPWVSVAGDRRRDLLIAAHLALGDVVDLHPPALQRRIALVHAEEIAREKRRLVAAGAGAHFEDGGGVLVLVLGREEEGHGALSLRQGFGKGVQFGAGERGHLRIAAFRHFLQIGAFGANLGERLHRLRHRLQLRILLAEPDDLGAVAGGGQARLHLTEAVEHLIEFGLGQQHGRAS